MTTPSITTAHVDVAIKECVSKDELRDFINLPFWLYRTDPFFSPKLKRDYQLQFSNQHPFKRHNDVRFYLAYKGAQPVGRIASIINYQHIKYHQEEAGFFGFYESINEIDVAKALFDKVVSDLKKEGLHIMYGPMNYSTNEECGLLVEGFDEPPMIMMPYNPSYYDGLITASGLQKAKDLLAYIYELQDQLPDKVKKVAEFCRRRGVKVRTITKKDFFSDMKAFQEVYNKAWSLNWCFVPITDEELEFTARQLKAIVREEMVALAEANGKSVGFLGIIPDFNPVLRAMRGRLTPLSIIKAIRAYRKINQGRLLLFGIVPEFRNKGVDALLFEEVHKRIIKTAIKRIEFSWILEDNEPTKRMVEVFGGRLYKRYRIYQKDLT